MIYVNYKFYLLLILSWAIVCKSRKPRLAGGYPARIGDFPYLVASMHPEIRCTATLINPPWIIGAAHCYVIDGQVVNPNDVLLIAGVVDFFDGSSSSRQSRTAKQIFVHPNFEEIKISEADISLVRVDDFEITPSVSPIPISGKPFVVNTDVPCTASGWGDTVFSRSNSKLHTLKVIAVQSKKVCHGLSPNERRKMLCLRWDQGKGLCDGDSGGPLVCNGELVGVAHQVYIEKYKYKGPQDMECGSSSIVHTYMYVCPYLNWIRHYDEEAPPKPDKCFTLNVR
ncbi:hypothetical protein O3M35_000968 [Rhynocoris fuscipes]|uniref:Peptidase S1 domain-containing protein n=1 Tax=Rhynocoris fuscipes TaxID=488301 RepID=A0AAW1DPL1_9HEMI